MLSKLEKWLEGIGMKQATMDLPTGLRRVIKLRSRNGKPCKISTRMNRISFQNKRFKRERYRHCTIRDRIRHSQDNFRAETYERL